jgi:periplasmic copper chaperone A
MDMKRRNFLLVLLAATPAGAHSLRFGDIAIGHAWALPSQQLDGQVFFPMANKGEKPEQLVGARSEICTLIELRQNNRYDDPPLAKMALDPGQPVPMRPTAKHLRLVALRRPLVVGDRFKVILDFLNAGEVEVEVFVEELPGE